ncbi:MAG: amidohydrolase [bacterium]
MPNGTLIHNARIYTLSEDVVVDSLAMRHGCVQAIGHNLQHAGEFRSYRRWNLDGRTVVPGFVDAHTHFLFFAMSLGHVRLYGLSSPEACLKEIEKFSRRQGRNEWIVGEGYEPHRFRRRVEPERFMLDRVTGGRPAFIFSKDGHSAWVNSRALQIAGISRKTRDPSGGEIIRDENGTPTGILCEYAAYGQIYNLIPLPPRRKIDRCYRQALNLAYRKGVTGVHSFDGPNGFAYFSELAEKNRVGLRINYYAPARLLPQLRRTDTRYGTGTDYFRIAGIKVFADGSLGSRTALCFRRYLGSRNRCGIEVTSTDGIRRLSRSAARLGLPCAVHAIGDRAVANVIDALEDCPPLPPGARHRIEHLQLVRRKDLPRLKRLNIIASMQPSHCPTDIALVRRYWGVRGANAFIFRTLLDKGIDLAFGSDVPIEPLDPIGGIAAAVRRARPGSRDVFYPEQKISAREALYNFTVGPAIAAGERNRRGCLQPGYPADLVVLSDDITRVPPRRIYDVQVLATVLNGRVKYADSSLRL